jgi:predicted metal-dependent hydrolase
MSLLPARIPFLNRALLSRPSSRRVGRTARPSHIEVTHEGHSYRVVLKPSVKAKRLTLRVSAATRAVTLTLPQRSDERLVMDFAQRHSAWIAARMARLEDEIVIAPGALIPFRGTPHHIIHRANARGTVWIEEAQDGASVIVVAGRSDHAARRVKDFLKKEARRALDRAVERYTDALGIPARRIALKDTRSRWGSCSSDGRLNFSWRLIFAPSEILDYLAAHEVAHLKEHNHSARFWATVAVLYPDYKKAEAWLKRNGVSLHRYR